MFIPKYEIFIKKECFYPDQAICLGEQLIKIVKFLSKFLPRHIWYAGDVDAYNLSPIDFELGSPLLKKIGNDYKIINLSSRIQQFNSGVFLSIKDPLNIQENNQIISGDIRVSTDDLPFRPILLDNILIEIRAIDTSFFSIYSESEDFIRKLSENFNVGIEITHKEPRRFH